MKHKAGEKADKEFQQLPFQQGLKIDPKDMLAQSETYLAFMNKRRSVRDFSEKMVEKKIIEFIIMTASTAPSGANKQPWTFCAVANAATKQKIRLAAEREEKKNYGERMSKAWKHDLSHLGTTHKKPFLEQAPWLIVVFKKNYELDAEGEKRKNYYVDESVGLACGMLITAIYQSGLVTVPYTPSPMHFLSELLNRPENEKPFLVFPVGYPHDKAEVPDIKRKCLDEIGVFYE